MNTAGPRGNVAAVERDAEKIARRYLAGEISIEGLTSHYHVAYYTLMRVLELHTTADQRAAVNYARLMNSGRKNRFRKGHATWNKGRKIGSRPGSRATQFKPGRMRGAAARNWRPVGTITIRHDKPAKRYRRGRRTHPGRPKKRGLGKYHGPGRRWIKVSNFGRPQDRWQPYARWLWEKTHGPIPPGMNVVHLDGNILNDLAENLALLDDRARMRLQEVRDPAFRQEQRKATAAASTLRHETRRQAKAIRALRAGRVRWECRACGHDVGQKQPPERCIKCGGAAFEKLELQAAG